MNRPTPSDDAQEQFIQTVVEPLQQLLQQQAAKQESASRPKRSEGDQPRSHKPVLPFRPIHRQPLAILTILDDGCRDKGERIRVRKSTFTIGRESGDVALPFDSDVSAQHVELRCQAQKGRFRWYLIDKASTNGTFVRAFRASLSRDSELMIGSRRYLFELPSAALDGIETSFRETQAFQPPNRSMFEHFVPRLREVGVSESHAISFALGDPDVMLGTDPRCQLQIDSDSFASPKHARIYQDETGRWMIEDQKSLNGVWIRIKRFPLDKHAEFQIGQQQFRFQPDVGQPTG